MADADTQGWSWGTAAPPPQGSPTEGWSWGTSAPEPPTQPPATRTVRRFGQPPQQVPIGQPAPEDQAPAGPPLKAWNWDVIRAYPTVIGSMVNSLLQTPVIPKVAISAPTTAEALQAASRAPGAPAILQHPIVQRGLDIAAGASRWALEFGRQMTAPANIGMMFGTEGVGLLPGALSKISQYLPRAISGVFSWQMLKGAYDQVPAVKQAIDKGDYAGAASTITSIGLQGLMGAAGALHLAFDTTGRFARSLEEHNANAEVALQKEAQQQTPVGQGEGTPVEGLNRPMSVRTATLGPDGSPSSYDVIDPDTGEVLHEGDYPSVANFIRQYQAQSIEGDIDKAAEQGWSFPEEPPSSPEAPAPPGEEVIPQAQAAGAGPQQEVPSVSVGEGRGAEQPATVGGGEAGVEGGAPGGEPPVPVRGVPPQGPSGLGSAQPQSAAGGTGERAGAVAGSTGSAEDVVTGETDLPLDTQGERDAKTDAKKVADVDEVNTSPKQRGEQTGAAVGEVAGVKPQPDEALAPWNLGPEIQGRPQTEVKALMDDYIVKRPDEAPPGGESFNDFSQRFIGGIQQQMADYQPGQKILNITHSIGIHTALAWSENGSPQDRSIDNQAMLDRTHMDPGSLWRMNPKTGVMTEAKNDAKPGIYFQRHADTAWDNLKPGEAVPNAADAGAPNPEVAQEPPATLPGKEEVSSVTAPVPSVTAAVLSVPPQERPPLPDRIMSAMRALEPTPGVPVSMERLRAALPDVGKPDFDSAMLQLRQNQQIYLHPHDSPMRLPPEQRATLVPSAGTNPNNLDEHYVAASERGSTPAAAAGRTSIGRTTPAKGTPEREQIESEYDRLRKAIDEQTPIVEGLQAKYDKAGYGTKTREAAGRKLEVAKDKLDGLYAELNPITKRSYRAMLEDAVESDNPILRQAAGLKLDEELGRRTGDRYSTVEKTLTTELEPIARAAAVRVEDGRAYLSPQQEEQAIRNAAVSTARNYLSFPLTAEEDIPKRMEGHVRGERLQIFRNEAQEEISAIDNLIREEGLQRSRVPNVRDMYDFEQISKAVENERKVLADRQEEKRLIEEQDKAASISLAERLEPIGDLKPTARTKGIWNGNVILGNSPFVTDGTMMMPISAVQGPKSMAGLPRKASALAEAAKTPSATPEQATTIWERSTGADLKPVQFLGADRSNKTVGSKMPAFFVNADGNIVTVDANKLAFIKSAIGADDIKASTTSTRAASPLVLFRDGKPSALLMPWKNPAITPDLAIARSGPAADKIPAGLTPEKAGERGAVAITPPNVRAALQTAGSPAAQMQQFLGARNNAARALLSTLNATGIDSRLGEKIRTFTTGERDYRVAETNQLRDVLRQQLPDPLDQEALTLLRDFKNRPNELAEFRNGTHPEFQALSPQQQQVASQKIMQMRPVIDRVLNPSPALLAADQELTNYFRAHLAEGKQLGFLDSSIPDEEYITHVFAPDQRTAGSWIGRLSRGRLGPRKFRYNLQRSYPTVLHAVLHGVEPKTINALDALGVYGEKYATTAAYHFLTTLLRSTATGKWGTQPMQRAGQIPADWVPLAPDQPLFQQKVPYLDQAGEARLASRSLYVPPDVAKAMHAITDPNFMERYAWWQNVRQAQQVVKIVELGFSIFHMKALALSAQANMGPGAAAAALVADKDSQDFLDAEKAWMRFGLTTPITGKTIEIYKALRPTSLPTVGEKIRNLPGIKQADKAAAAISHFTFGVMQRKLKVIDASLKFAAWSDSHPNATDKETAEAMRLIAKEINAVYGGLHWENMGVGRTIVELSRAIFLAPDWFYSDLATWKYALQKGLTGDAARVYMLWGAVSALLGTAALSWLWSRKLSKDPTRVILGKDREGHDVDDNLFFVGAIGDLSTLIHNVARYGALVGTARTFASKFGPVTKTAVALSSNKSARGGSDIIPRTISKSVYTGQPLPRTGPRGGRSRPPTWGEKNVLGAEEAAGNTLPVPFTVTTIAKMLANPKEHYRLSQYFEALISGRQPRAVNQ